MTQRPHSPRPRTAVLLLTLTLTLGAAPTVAANGSTTEPIDSTPHLPPAVDRQIAQITGNAGLEDIFEGPFLQMDNQTAGTCIDAAGLTFLAFFPGSLTWGPIEWLSEVAVYAADMVLKHCAARVFAPPARNWEPTVRNADGEACWVEFDEQPVDSGEYENLLGVVLPNELKIFGAPLPADWGPYGNVQIDHFNTGVDVTQSAPGFAQGTKWRLPIGQHTNVWTGTTNVSLLDWLFLPIPGPFSVTDQQAKNVKWELAKKMAGSLLFDIAAGYGLGQIDAALSDGGFPISWPTAQNHQFQSLTVWDLQAPTFEVPPQFELIATDPGGALLRNHTRVLLDSVHAEDECDRPVDVFFRDLPQFLKVDVPYTATWTARDQGPRQGGTPGNDFHEVNRTTTVIARDLFPPDINPPDHRVVISTEPMTEVDLGWPQVFDAVDLEPTIHNTAPPSGRFPQGVTEVTWWAVDQSGNESRRVVQRVNVKAGNRAPTAIPRIGSNAPSTRTWEDLTVPLEGFDPDPQDFVNFEITTPPADGFFKAPLYPAFVEDYRVESQQSYDELAERCDGVFNGPWDAEFPYSARYVDVADDGTTYVIDRGGFFCQAGGDGHLDTDERLAVFDAEGNLKRRPDGSAVSILADPEGIWIDKINGRIYLTDSFSSGTSRVFVYDLDLEPIISFRIDYGDAPPGENQLTHATNAVADHARQILYVSNRTTVRAFRSDRHVENGQSDEPVVLGTIARFGAGRIRDIEIDSEGNLYLSHMEDNQIHKYGASHFDELGAFVPGPFLGWMGRCYGQFQNTEQPVCDLSTQTSIGFSCSDDLCDGGRSGPSFGSDAGEGPGQFNWPRGLAMSPDDVLYVTDYQNERIQRFTPEGYWAGEAKSSCDGVCFVLGAFNSPEDITVNSNHFYLLDQETNLLHVSKTTPIEIENGLNATVTYRSDYFFQGRDAFEYRVHDGLEASPPARIEIVVGAGQRPPEGTTGAGYTVFEDTPIVQDFTGFDPDGGGVTFVVDEAPQHGEVRREGGNWIYFPDADYHGEDTFTYRATDQHGASEAARVDIEIIANFDVPTVDVPDVRPAGRGFPWQLKADVLDPDDDESFSAEVNWGDGTSGRDVPVSEENPGGPFLNVGRDRATLTGSHTWSDLGQQSVRACVVDRDQFEGCSTIEVPVRERVDVALFNDLSEELEERLQQGDTFEVGETLDFELTVVNRRPEGWRGLDVLLIEVEDELPSAVRFDRATVQGGLPGETCSARSDGTRGYRCNLVGLAPGEERRIDVRVELMGAGDLLTLSDAVATPVSTSGNLNVSGLDADAVTGNNAQRIVAEVTGGSVPPPPVDPPADDCAAGQLCLQGGRFRVEVDWQATNGSSGAATPVPGSDDSGLFWFFDASNWEMLVKVLDGCGVNGSFWVLAAATTDVGYELRVEDTWSGEFTSYTNRPGTAAPATIDVEAIDGCGASGPDGALTSTDSRSATTSGVVDGELQSAQVAKARATWKRTMAARIEQMKAMSTGALPMSTECLVGGTTLCLDDQRFHITVDWRAANGQSGRGTVVPLGTADSGLFWFFDASNWEMLVKVLDGCALNQRYWVLGAVTTDVEYTLTVTDTATDETSTYFNPLGNAADAVIDTDAFATCGG